VSGLVRVLPFGNESDHSPGLTEHRQLTNPYSPLTLWGTNDRFGRWRSVRLWQSDGRLHRTLPVVPNAQASRHASAWWRLGKR